MLIVSVHPCLAVMNNNQCFISSTVRIRPSLRKGPPSSSRSPRYCSWGYNPLVLDLLRIHVEDCQIRNDNVHALCTSEREVAFLFDLGVAVLIAMGLSYHYLGLLRTGYEVLIRLALEQDR